MSVSKKLAACIQQEVDKQSGRKASGRSGSHPDNKDTDRWEHPTVDDYAQANSRRLALALLACDGLDEHTLLILSQKDSKGHTNLQRLMRKVNFT